MASELYTDTSFSLEERATREANSGATERMMTRLGDTRMPPPYRVDDKDSTDQLLAERGRTHGKFEDTAGIAQSIKAAMRSTTVWHQLDVEQKEALEMIATKIGRILGGNPDHKDSWTDIAGYARLIEDRI
jgi:hypothetical protein